MTRSLIAGLALACAAPFATAGCGGHTAKYTVDEVSLAQIPMDEKKAIFDAQNEVSVAKAEKAKADADADATKQEIALAEAERDQAKLEVEKAKLEGDIAEKAKDVVRQQQAAEKRRIAELGKRAAEAKVDSLEAKRTWQKAVGDQADARISATVSKVELEKAKLAQAKNIKPTKDFDPSKFAEDYDRRAIDADKARSAADRKKEAFERAATDWKNLKAQFDQAAAPPPPPPAAPAPVAPAK